MAMEPPWLLSLTAAKKILASYHKKTLVNARVFYSTYKGHLCLTKMPFVIRNILVLMVFRKNVEIQYL